MKRVTFWAGPLLVALVLVALLLPLLAETKQCGGEYGERWCVSNLKQIGLSLVLYQQKNGDGLPPLDGRAMFDTLYQEKLLEDMHVYVCYRTDTPGQIDEGRRLVVSYRTWSLGRPIDAEFLRRVRLAGFPIAWDREAVHGGQRAVLFLDGHAEVIEEDRFLAYTDGVGRVLGFDR